MVRTAGLATSFYVVVRNEFGRGFVAKAVEEWPRKRHLAVELENLTPVGNCILAVTLVWKARAEGTVTDAIFQIAIFSRKALKLDLPKSTLDVPLNL